MVKKTRKEKEDENSGLFVPAGLLLGMGFGFLFNELVAGLFIGLGAGFFGMAIIRNAKKKSRK